ncbi:D-alanine--D-alanine ligase [bacterium]|nr:D-alanine--D-alanine ligase [bacterium]
MKPKQKVRVAILFGGRSTEHEVSLNSALSILKNIDRSKYVVIPVKISKAGQWRLLPNPERLHSVEDLQSDDGDLLFAGDPLTNGFYRILKESEKDASMCSSLQIDVVFPILHGTFGEDGSLQGLLSMADLPCVGGGVLASSIGMDKILMKQVFFQNDLPATDYLWFLRKDWEQSDEKIQNGVQKEIGFPCFVKPANTGSSVGVCKACNLSELAECIELAVRYDRKILVEKAIDARELECSVLGNDDPKASVVGEIIPANEFYDYEAKYHSDQSQTLVPADLPEDISKNVQWLAVSAYKAIDCAGMGRVDFFLERETNRLFVNEINTIPGFTPISMYPKLWEASGISYSELIDRLIELALERHRDIHHSAYQK